MNLYRLTQNENRGYDTYDACIVAARTLDDAAQIHPSAFCKKCWDQSGSWASTPENVNVEYIGKAATGIERGVILASFNAG